MTADNRQRRKRAPIWVIIAIAAGLLVAGGYVARAKGIPDLAQYVRRGQSTSPGGAATPLRIGYLHTPMLAPLFRLATEDTGVNYRLIPFIDDEELGVALKAGQIDAAFFEPVAGETLLTRRAPKQPDLRLAGGIEYPYGVTLVVRKGFQKRTNELAGSTIGAGEPDCRLLKQFRADAKKLPADLSKVHFTYLSDDALLPALAAGKLDGAIVKSATAMLALAHGASVLYQNSHVTGTDSCCPKWTTEAELLLLVAPGHDADVARFTRRLEEISRTATRKELDQALVHFMQFPVEALEGNWPSPVYKPLGAELRKRFADYLWSAP